jgi:hypothetical protein
MNFRTAATRTETQPAANKQIQLRPRSREEEAACYDNVAASPMINDKGRLLPQYQALPADLVFFFFV